MVRINQNFPMKFNYCLLILFCRFSFYFLLFLSFLVFWLSLLFASKFSVQTKSHVFLKSSVCSALRACFCHLLSLKHFSKFSLFILQMTKLSIIEYFENCAPSYNIHPTQHKHLNYVYTNNIPCSTLCKLYWSFFPWKMCVLRVFFISRDAELNRTRSAVLIGQTFKIKEQKKK